jgi:hypothetical protein
MSPEQELKLVFIWAMLVTLSCVVMMAWIIINASDIKKLQEFHKVSQRKICPRPEPTGTYHIDGVEYDTYLTPEEDEDAQ